MRRYDDPVEVRRGRLTGPHGTTEVAGGGDPPHQFLWHERLWQVRAVVAHWVETGPWWQSPGVRAVVGSDEPSEQALAGAGRSGAPAEPVLVGHDLLREREVWRVEAVRPGRSARVPGRPDPVDGDAGPASYGVFDLVLDGATGGWRLAGCVD